MIHVKNILHLFAHMNEILQGREKIEYWPNGNKYTQGYWVNGKKHGEHLFWDAHGNLCLKGCWVNGEKHGDHLFWNYSDKIAYKINYQSSKRNGEIRLQGPTDI